MFLPHLQRHNRVELIVLNRRNNSFNIKKNNMCNCINTLKIIEVVTKDSSMSFSIKIFPAISLCSFNLLYHWLKCFYWFCNSFRGRSDDYISLKRWPTWKCFRTMTYSLVEIIVRAFFQTIELKSPQESFVVTVNGEHNDEIAHKHASTKMSKWSYRSNWCLSKMRLRKDGDLIQ